ncbi:MAG: T9SS type A sorting domain-containing protein [Flavipsychrobacter sp.]|nr:T9SS type A sorting domain-containing protein [Flavipsychrobacter sp.]
MIKKILLFSFTSVIGYFALSSYTSGPARNGLNRTGCKGNTNTSCGGGGCHGGTSANTTVSIIVDSAGGVAVTNYKPGITYTVVIQGSNTSSLPKFGFQFASVSGTGAAQVQAGTSTAPVHCRISLLSGINFVEQSTQIAAVSGLYTVSIPWTAPATGTGTVTMYCTLNAVDGTGNQNSTDVSNFTSTTLSELTTGVAELTQDIATKVYPNPATSQFTIKMDNAGTGIYNVNIYDISGRIIATQNIRTNGTTVETVINCSNWPKGYYGVQIAQNGAQRVLPVVKL